jgi:hypothetical protein
MYKHSTSYYYRIYHTKTHGVDRHITYKQKLQILYELTQNMFECILGPNTNDMFRILFSVRNRNRQHNAIVYSYDTKALTEEIILNNWQPDLERFRYSYFNRNLYFQCIDFATNIPQIIIIFRTTLRQGMSLYDFK